METKIRMKKYILKYIEPIPLDDIEVLKDRVEMLPYDCELQNIGSDNKVYYLCSDMIVARNKERAMSSAELNYPEIPRGRMMLFTDKGKRLVYIDGKVDRRGEKSTFDSSGWGLFI